MTVAPIQLSDELMLRVHLHNARQLEYLYHNMALPEEQKDAKARDLIRAEARELDGLGVPKDLMRIAEKVGIAYDNARKSGVLPAEAFRLATGVDVTKTLVVPELGDSRSAAPSAANKFSAATPEIAKALDFLAEVNGQDAYSSVTAGVGKIDRAQYLVLPTDFTMRSISPAEVGTQSTRALYTIDDFAKVYVLNKNSAPNAQSAVQLGTLRAYAVTMGWVAETNEIRYADVPDDYAEQFMADVSKIQPIAEMSSKLAYMLPMVAEIVFRTTGHHFLTGQAADYIKRYNDILRACLIGPTTGYLDASILFHWALHWVSPARAFRVASANAETDKLPEAIKIRLSSTPAGTAIITTTAAVIEAMTAAGFGEQLADHSGGDSLEVVAFAHEVKNDPTKYHVAYQAYGLPAMDPAMREKILSLKAKAAKLAPVAQGFVNGVLRKAPLAKSKALQKFANENPVMLAQATAFFRKCSTETKLSIADLYATTTKAVARVELIEEGE